MLDPAKALRLIPALLLCAATLSAQQTDRSPLPVPTGAYAVGRTQFDWSDASRSDAQNPDGHRELVVWVWYPASSRAGAENAEWLPGKWAEAFWPGYVKGHPAAATKGSLAALHGFRTHAITDAPVAPGAARFPVLMFAPGLGDTPLDYASVIEDVASHGYIVAGVVPTYFAGFSVFSDGRVVEGRDIIDAVGAPAEARRSAEATIRAWEQGARIMSADLTFALNQLVKADSDARSPLKGRLDLARVGTFGHSAGGAAVLQFAHDDARARAALALDPSPIWSAANGSLGKPLLILSAASTQMGYGVLDGASPALHLRMAGTVHQFPADLRIMPFSAPVVRDARDRNDAPATPPPGQIDAARGFVVTSSYVEAFFDRYLTGRNSALLNGPSSQFPEITFELKRP